MSVEISYHQWSLIAEKVMRETALSVVIKVMEPQSRVEICSEEQDNRETVIEEFYKTLFDIEVLDHMSVEKSSRTEHDIPNIALLSSSPSSESNENCSLINNKETERMSKVQNYEISENEKREMESSNASIEAQREIKQLQDERCAIGEMVREIAGICGVVDVNNYSQHNTVEENNYVEESTLSITDTLQSILQKMQNRKDRESEIVECDYRNNTRMSSNNNQFNNHEKSTEHEKESENATAEKDNKQECTELHQEQIDLEDDEEEEQEEQQSLKESENESTSNKSVCRVLYERILPPRLPSASEKMRLSLNTVREQVEQLRRHDISCLSTPTQAIVKSNHSLVSTPRTHLESNHELEEEHYPQRANLRCNEQNSNLPLSLTPHINDSTNVLGVNALFRGAAVPTRRLYPHFSKRVDHQSNVKAANWTAVEPNVYCNNETEKEISMEMTPEFDNVKAGNRITMTPWRQRIQEIRQELQTLRGAASSGDCQTSCNSHKQ